MVVYVFDLHCNCTYVLNICFALIWCFAEPHSCHVIRGRNIYFALPVHLLLVILRLRSFVISILARLLLRLLSLIKRSKFYTE